jgi:hypothetical protein
MRRSTLFPLRTAVFVLAFFAGCASDEPIRPDTTPPRVTVTSPAPGSELSSTTRIMVDASDEKGVASVFFAVDGDSVGRDDEAPYELDWSVAYWADGSVHTIQADAVDLAGNAGHSDPVPVTVSLSASAVPVLASPADSALLGPATVGLAWRPVPEAAAYTVELSSATDFTPAYVSASTADTQAVVVLPAPGRFYWRVRAVNGAGRASAWSARTLYHAVFVSTSGGFGDDRAYGVVQMQDGGFVAAGTTLGAGGYDVYLARADASGNFLWSRSFGGAAHDGVYGMNSTADGGCVLAGYTGSSGSGSYDMYLVKLDAAGNTEWSKTYGASASDAAYSVEQTADGGYFLAGETYTYGTGHSEVYAVKTDASGGIAWERRWSETPSDFARYGRATTDGGYVLAGGTLPGDTVHALLLKVDASGEIEWRRTYLPDRHGEGYCVERTDDGGYIVGGREGLDLGRTDALVFRTDRLGYQVWSRDIHVRDWSFVSGILQMPDGGFILNGSTDSTGGSLSDIFLAKLDPAGAKVWSRPLGGIDDDWAMASRLTSDGGIILAGTTRSFGVGGFNLCLTKAGPDGSTVPFPSRQPRSSARSIPWLPGGGAADSDVPPAPGRTRTGSRSISLGARSH